MILALKEVLSVVMKKKTSKDDEGVYLQQEYMRKNEVSRGDSLKQSIYEI